jgi:hypothetical protein
MKDLVDNLNREVNEAGLSQAILILVGIPGSGKSVTVVALAKLVRIQHISIEAYRQAAAPPEEIALNLARAAANGPVVFECSGASQDFEEILHALAARGISACVVGLLASETTALSRLSTRIPYSPPKGGRGWAEHIRWCATRLALVPTNADVDAEQWLPDERARAVLAAWTTATAAGGSFSAETPSTIGVITFSQLRRWQVCGREYAYRYVWRTPCSDVLPSSVAVGEAAHEALGWLHAARQVTLSTFLDVYHAKISALGIANASDMVQRGRDILESYYLAHRHGDDDETTLGIELPVTLSLTPALALAGRLDRLTANTLGELEITEFKLRKTRHGSRPRVPELLQPAAYATAVMAMRHRDRAFVRLHFLEQDLILRDLLDETDALAVRRALNRWLGILTRRGLDARPGYHCRHCTWRTLCPAAASGVP